jgi:hypothetical protein
MQLSDEESWNLISTCLENANWSADDIQNISEKSLQQVVTAINKKLSSLHKKSNPLIKSVVKANAALYVWYNMKILELSKEYGEEIPANLVLLALNKFVTKQEQLKQSFIKSLHKIE